MTIVRTPGGKNVQARDIFAGVDQIPSPAMEAGVMSYAGRRVSTGDAVGLPAVMSAIRLLSETIGTMPVVVARADGEERERLPDSEQWQLLHVKPNAIQTPFAFYAYIIASLQRGNAYLLKGKDKRGIVRELYPLNPERVVVKTKENTLTYKVRQGGKTVTLTRGDLIHIPGLLWDDPYVGISPITLHKNSIGSALAAEEFAGRFFTNDGNPGGIITVPGNLTKPQHDEMIENWKSQHQGVASAHKTGLLYNGASYMKLGVSMEDAAYVESQRFSVQQVARMFRVPAMKIGDDAAQKPSNTHPEIVNQEFLTYSLLPWITRIEQGLYADDELFPDKTIGPAFVVENLLRADIGTRYEAYLKARQAGWLTANEIRAKEDEPPVEGGDELQATPVGGAVNEPGPKPTDNEPHPTEA